MTPLDYVKDKKKKQLADNLEKTADFFMTSSDRVISPEKTEEGKREARYKSSAASFNKSTSIERLIEKAEHGEMMVTDDMVYPPTMSYLPTESLLTFMINRATKAKRGEDGKYGFIFWGVKRFQSIW